MRTVVVSDTHLGTVSGRDLLRRPAPRAALAERVRDADHVDLLGDLLELRETPLAAALAHAEPLFRDLGAALGDGRVTVVRVTPAGGDVYRRVREVRTAYMGEVLAEWSARDRAALTRLVDRLVDDLKAVRFRPDLNEGARR